MTIREAIKKLPTPATSTDDWLNSNPERAGTLQNTYRNMSPHEKLDILKKSIAIVCGITDEKKELNESDEISIAANKIVNEFLIFLCPYRYHAMQEIKNHSPESANTDNSAFNSSPSVEFQHIYSSMSAYDKRDAFKKTIAIIRFENVEISNDEQLALLDIMMFYSSYIQQEIDELEGAKA